MLTTYISDFHILLNNMNIKLNLQYNISILSLIFVVVFFTSHMLPDRLSKGEEVRLHLL